MPSSYYDGPEAPAASLAVSGLESPEDNFVNVIMLMLASTATMTATAGINF